METIFTDPLCDSREASDLTILTNAPGTYALVIQLAEPAGISVGKLGAHHFYPGYYVYLGSALGPGGLYARISRHLRWNTSSKLHWHIDYLLRSSALSEVWWAPGDARLECSWSETLLKGGDVFPRGFGSSDCSCVGHLVAFRSASSLVEGRNRLRQEVGLVFRYARISQAPSYPGHLEE